IPFLLNGFSLSAMPKPTFFSSINNSSDRVLVLIQLNGGNDGLNTLIPMDQYDKLANVRSNILLPENSLLSLDDKLALHPNMSGIRSVFDDAKATFIQSVAYPNQNRSHFRSTDIWTSGSAADVFETTGWLGRHFGSLHPTFPTDFPNEDYPDPFAITIDNIVSETCQGVGSNFSMAFTDPFALSPIDESGQSETPDSPYGVELAFVRQAIAQSNAYSGTILEAANNGTNIANYPTENQLASHLRTVAQLISGGLGTKVYVVNIGGFDTHAGQVVAGNPQQGVHANLLQTLSDAVEAFMRDLQQLGLDQRVIAMTFSEFGRRIRSNDSVGTDHGTAAPLMVFGSCVNPGIIGENPEISEDVSVQEGVAMQYDFRSIYGSILMDWFEVPEDQVRSLLYDGFQYIPILQPCKTTSTIDLSGFGESIESHNFPNPFENWTNISFESKGERMRVSVFDDLGSEIQLLSDQYFPAGEHRLRFEAHHLPAGHYYYRIQSAQRQKTKLMVKIR
ncbi:MAG: DUF1501 domain-containing protein, partial [Bacteroidota bacterium]